MSCLYQLEVHSMLTFNQNRSHSLEQSLKEGYVQMADLNLSLATEAFPLECEACVIVTNHILHLIIKVND